MRSALLVLAPLSLGLAGCGQPTANNSASANGAGTEAAPAAAPNAPAPAPTPAGNESAAASRDQILRTETVSGIFTGWEMGDYLWAHIQVPGREQIGAQPGPTPVDLFLDANRGRPVTVEIATVRANVPEAGGEIEIQRITAARNAAGTAEAWWQGLSAADRAAAQRRFEQGALSGR